MSSFHDYALYAGIMVKPDLQGLLAFKLYAGSTRSHLHGPASLSNGKDYTIIQLRRPMIGTELLLLNLFQNTKAPDLLNGMGLSLYYECRFMNTARLYFDDGKSQQTIHFSRFTNAGFLKKYTNDQLLGLKLSFNLI